MLVFSLDDILPADPLCMDTCLHMISTFKEQGKTASVIYDTIRILPRQDITRERFAVLYRWRGVTHDSFITCPWFDFFRRWAC